MNNLREDVINLSKDRLDESVALGITLAAILGLTAAASVSVIADAIKAKNWEKAKKAESIERNAWKFSDQDIITSFKVDEYHNLETYIIPSEDFLMKFAKKRVVIAPAINKVFVFEAYEFGQFLKETKEILIKRYKELFEKLHYYSCDEKEKADIKKYLEKKLSVEFYCRGMVALTKEQKKEVEKMIKSAVKEAGVDKFKFKLLSATYR